MSWRGHVPAIVFAAAALAYLPSLWGGFLYDDIAILVDNRHIQDLSALPTILRYEPARPLLGLTWALNYAAAGRRPWPYHLVNLLLHAVNAALVASLLAWIARRSRRPDPESVALWGGALFAVTPMAVESVAYIASRSTLLSAGLSLGCLRLAVGLFDAPARLRFAGALGLLALALASKEDAAVVPLLLVLIDVFFVSPEKPSLRKRWGLHATFFLLPCAGLVARRLATGSWLPEPVVSRGLYALTQMAAFPEYLLRILVPVDPAFFRGALLASWPPPVGVALLALLGAAVLAAAWIFRGRAPTWAFAVLWLAVALLPSSTLVPLNEMIVDHRAYVGIAGVSLVVACFLAHPDRRYFGGLLLVILVGLNLRYQYVLGDPQRAWEDAVRRAPSSPDAHRALGEVYAERGDPRAERTLRLAAALDPQDGRSWANLGLFLAQQGRRGEAVEELRKAAAVDPGDARILDNLGLLLQSFGRLPEARQAYERAASVDPKLAQPRIRLAGLLIASGEVDRARALLAEAAQLEIDAEDARALEALRRRLP